MYPYFRAIYHSLKAKRQPKLIHPFEENKMKLRVWPLDIDMFLELNNGRYLVLMDIGRYVLGERMRLPKVLKDNHWGLMVGAVSSRYRRRLRPFQEFTLHSQLIQYTDRWFYFRQWFTTEQESKIHASFLVRTAVTSSSGLVPTKEVIEAMGYDDEQFAALNQPNEWITAWEQSDELHKEIMEGVAP